MSFLDAFECWKNVSAVITRISTVDDTSTGKQTEATTTINTLQCIFWVGSQAEAVVSEKLRGIISGVAIFDVGSDIKLHDEITINGTIYNALPPDNIALQDEALLIPLGAKK